jgi:hypothetical protein
MPRSLSRRIGGFVAAAALAVTSLGVVGTATPAHATACTTTTTFTPGASVYQWNDFMSVKGEVTTSCPDYIGAGTVVIQRSTNGGSSWTTLGGNVTPTYASFYGVNKLKTTALYRAYYSGGSYSDDTFAPSASPAKQIRIFREVDGNYRSVRGGVSYTFIIKPAASIKGKKAIVQVKRGAWKKYKAGRVSKKGKITFNLAGSRRGTKYRLKLPTSAVFVGSYHGVTVTTYREVPSRVVVD